MAENNSGNQFLIKPKGLQPTSLANILSMADEPVSAKLCQPFIYLNAQPWQGIKGSWNIGAQVYYSEKGKFYPKTKRIVSHYQNLNELQKNQIMYTMRDDYVKTLFYYGHEKEAVAFLRQTGRFKDNTDLQNHCMPKLMTTNQIILPKEVNGAHNIVMQEGGVFDYLEKNMLIYQPKIMQDDFWEIICTAAEDYNMNCIHPSQFSATLVSACISEEELFLNMQAATQFKANSDDFRGWRQPEGLGGRKDIGNDGKTDPESDYGWKGIYSSKQHFVSPIQIYEVAMHTPWNKIHLFYASAQTANIFLDEAEQEFIEPFEQQDEKLAKTEYELKENIPGYHPSHYTNLDMDKAEKFDRMNSSKDETYLEILRDPLGNKKRSMKKEQQLQPFAILNNIRPPGLN